MMPRALAARVAEHAPAMLLYLDAELRVRFANRHCYDLLGHAPRELLGRLLSELVDPGTLQYALGHVAALDGGERVPRDYVLRHKAGAPRYVRVHAVADRDKQGRPVGYIASSADNAAELAAQEQLDFALSGDGAGAWDWDLAADKVRYSAEFKALLGYGDGDFPHVFSFFKEMHPADEAATADAVGAAVDDGRIFDCEFRLRGADGAYRWLRGVGRAQRDGASGRAARFAGIARDITARKHAEAELRDARALVDATLEGCLAAAPEGGERRRLSSVRHELHAKANHELRTPLTVIIAALELLREGTDTGAGAEKESFLSLALQNAGQLARVLEQWLDLERIDLGLNGLQFESLEFAALVRAQLQAASALARERGVRVEQGEDTPGVQVRCDPARLRQVLAHLVTSAIDRSPRGAAVRVQVSGRDAQAVLLVEDEGPDVYGAADLGLHACKALLERLGGSLQVANRTGRGAAFHVVLPRAGAVAGAG